jgi:hypothetical protein
MATLLQALGALAITIGVGLMFIPAGIIIGGIFTLLFGIAAERK